MPFAVQAAQAEVWTIRTTTCGPSVFTTIPLCLIISAILQSIHYKPCKNTILFAHHKGYGDIFDQKNIFRLFVSHYLVIDYICMLIADTIENKDIHI